MDARIETPELRAISALLDREICRPLDALQASLNDLLAHPKHLPSATERNHLRTMIELCDDLRQLTHDRLGNAEETS